MKKRLPPFAAGMLTAALIGGLGLSALAASGQMTITVDPINIQVNGQTFQPKDAQGADVPVFAYNGTTYAPLRALAEAYGLEVGYDAQANMATVGAMDTEEVPPPIVLTEEPWTLIVDGEKYENGLIIYMHSTHFMVSILTESCPSTLLAELSSILDKANTINYNGSDYVSVNDVGDFYNAHAHNIDFDRESREYHIDF